MGKQHLLLLKRSSAEQIKEKMAGRRGAETEEKRKIFYSRGECAFRIVSKSARSRAAELSSCRADEPTREGKRHDRKVQCKVKIIRIQVFHIQRRYFARCWRGSEAPTFIRGTHDNDRSEEKVSPWRLTLKRIWREECNRNASYHSGDRPKMRPTSAQGSPAFTSIRRSGEWHSRGRESTVDKQSKVDEEQFGEKISRTISSVCNQNFALNTPFTLSDLFLTKRKL